MELSSFKSYHPDATLRFTKSTGSYYRLGQNNQERISPYTSSLFSTTAMEIIPHFAIKHGDYKKKLSTRVEDINIYIIWTQAGIDFSHILSDELTFQLKSLYLFQLFDKLLNCLGVSSKVWDSVLFQTSHVRVQG